MAGLPLFPTAGPRNVRPNNSVSCAGFPRSIGPPGPERLHGVFSGLVSSISPEAILPTMTAAPITSAGRFSPGGPRGIFRLFLCCFCETVIVLCHLRQIVLGVDETGVVRADRRSLGHVSDSMPEE